MQIWGSGWDRWLLGACATFIIWTGWTLVQWKCHDDSTINVVLHCYCYYCKMVIQSKIKVLGIIKSPELLRQKFHFSWATPSWHWRKQHGRKCLKINVGSPWQSWKSAWILFFKTSVNLEMVIRWRYMLVLLVVDVKQVRGWVGVLSCRRHAGQEDGIGVECLSGSGMIAGETSCAYSDIITMSLVSCRAVGIGAYLVRLGKRVVQVENSHIILTGASALNKVCPDFPPPEFT